MPSVKRHIGHRFLCVLKKCQQKNGAGKKIEEKTLDLRQRGCGLEPLF